MRSSEDDQPLFAPLDWMLALGIVLCVLAWLVHSLLSTPAVSYAASTPPRTPPVYAEDAYKMVHAEHAVMAAAYKEQAYEAWRKQVVLDAKIKAAKIKKAQLAAQQAQQQQAGGAISTAGFSSFKACVAMRESTDGQGSSNIYGILGGLWPGVPSDPWYSLASKYSSAWTAPASVQSQVFDMIYAQQGTAPWAQWDGC